MKFTAEQIAGILEGEVVGNPKIEVVRLSKIEEGTAGSLTFLSNSKYEHYIYTTQSSIAIVNKSFTTDREISTTLIKVDDAYLAFTKLLEFYDQAKSQKAGIEQPSVIGTNSTYGENFYLGSFSYVGTNVKMGNDVRIYPNCYIGDNTTIGSNVTIHPGAKIYSETIIGDNCTIHSGVILGSDGFGFAPNADGVFTKIPQIGNVILGNNVDIGACTTIDRATMGSTKIGNGVKLDNHIQIAHNVEIGENTVIAAQTGVAGSTKIGSNCMIGGQVGISGHLIIGNNVRMQAQSGVGRNIKDGEIIQGTPAYNYGDFSKSYVHFKNLPKLANDIEILKKSITKNN